MTEFPEAPYQETLAGLRREWMILARRRKFIAAIVALAVAGAAAFNYIVRPTYEGIAIVSAAESIPTMPYARLNTDVARVQALIDKEIARITGPEMAVRIADSLSANERTELAGGPYGPWYQRLRVGDVGRPPGDATLKPAQVASALRSRLQVTWREPTTWIEIRVFGFDPEAAAGLANRLAKQWIGDTAEANRATVESARATFESQLEGKEKQLGDQLSGLRERGSASEGGDVAARKATLERQVRGFQEALVAAQTARVGRAASGVDAARLGASGAPVAPDARLQAAEARVAELEDREKALLATMGAQHPEVITVREQLQTARSRLEAVTQSIQKAAASVYQMALNEEARIEANLQRAQKDLSGLEGNSFAFTMDQKKADASRFGVEQLLRVQETTAPVLVAAQSIQSAAPSSVPISPQKKQNLLYALLGGLALGVAVAFLLDRFDDTIQTPDDIKHILGLPFLGVVPLIPKLGHATLTSAVADAQTGFADGLRVVRTNLMYSPVATRPKVLVFTSASPGDGKSTVASGLAILLRETRAKVLLIDGDLRRPSVQTMFGVSAKAGLSELLAMNGPVKLAPVTNPAGLDILSAGPALTISAAQLGSDNMKALMIQARKRYDWVIIDSPPSLGLPDACVLATLADGVVVVCSGDKTPRQALASVNDQLRAVGAPLLGVVLNRVDMNRHSYYYGRYYSRYYGADKVRAPA